MLGAAEGSVGATGSGPPPSDQKRNRIAFGLDIGEQVVPPAPLLCTPPVPQDEIALLFSPVKDELYPNDPDACGYYFFPYELLEEINAKYGGFEVDEMVVEWADEAYAANAADHPELDYELLKKDTRTQRDATFGAPVPQLS